jgi:Ca-activated chloride channel family protein
VTFFLDGRQVMSKARPPYSLELDLGPIPRPHVVRAVALDAEGRRVGVDELDLNAGEHRFAVRLLSPRSGEAHVGPTEVRVELAVPEGERFDRLELFAGERPAATLYQEPFLHTLELPAGPVYVRAVAYLEDGSSREAVAFVNVTDPIEEIQVKLVELYAAVLDGAGRPATDLDRGDFRVVEDGVEQEVVRFERVTDRPVHVVLMIDSSASMAERIDAVRQAAAGFLHRILTPKDRAAVVAFSDRAAQDVEFTDRPDDLTIELAALQAERGTALWDNLISVLYHLNGVQGQRAVLLLSDGQDRSSSFTFAEVREFARAAGVAIYPIGIELSAGALLTRRELTLLASESGGRSFFIGGVDELDRVYKAIESELRSKYLLVYQSTGSGSAYREVRVEVKGGLEVKTLRGYYP